MAADFNRYMDIQQSINLKLHRGLAALGIEPAFPTSRVLLVTDDEPLVSGSSVGSS